MFEWGDADVEHIARDNIEPEEAEEAMTDPERVSVAAYNTPFEKRRAFIGKAYGGRILFVMFAKRGRIFRIGTARDATQREKKKYRRRG